MRFFSKRPSVDSKDALLKDRQIEWREWILWLFAVIVTLALTAGILFLAFSAAHGTQEGLDWYEQRERVRGLAALVLLFDIYTVYQHLQLQRVRRQLSQHHELFRLITENAADMIAVVDADGKRIYNSPSYEKVLGYSAEELGSSTALNQVHPADQPRVKLAAEKAQKSGTGERLEYRMRHKNGSWRFLESTASPVRGPRGEIEKLVIVNRDITERRQAEEKLAHNALHDALTGLANRALFVDRLQSALIRAQLHPDYKFAVLFMDIDGLKVINESLGHAAGDELLIKLAKRLTSGFRSTDSVARTTVATPNVNADTKAVARFAGGEFTVLLEDVANAANAIRIGRRIQERLAVPLNVSGREVVTSISVGAVLASKSYAEAGDILRDGEIAMFRAKSKGKGNCEVFDAGMHRQALRRLQLETELRRAVDTGETIVHYQPIISLATGHIVGFEALSRWKGPEGMISPAEFIPVAEETGLIRALNHNLYTDACRQLRAWQAEFGSKPPLIMSMNITGKQFADPGLPVEVQNILRETGVAPDSVHLEIMETIAMADPAHALSLLTELKRIGVVLMIDDFGTGYSSLSRLPKFPIDALKIDRAFICNLIEDRESHEIVRLIVTLAHSLGLKIVAEGTETKEQVEAVRSLGCEMAQGYFFARPVSDVEARELLVRQGGQALSSSQGAGR